MTSQQAVRGVEVDGGTIAVELSQGRSLPVLAIHGISSTRKLWSWLRAQAPDLTLIAPDLRGRGDSRDVGGQFGVPQHSDDMASVLDTLGLEAVHVCGMSMGGFIAVDFAGRHPERVRSLVLVDGGPPMPHDLTPETLPAVLGDRLARLEQRWASVDEYAEYFARTTGAGLDPSDPLMRDYLEHDLATDGKVRLSAEALLRDAEDVFFGGSAWGSLEHSLPIRLAYAEWGAGTGSPPAYAPSAVAELRPRLATDRYLPGLDHAGAIMTKSGSVAVADLITEALA